MAHPATDRSEQAIGKRARAFALLFLFAAAVIASLRVFDVIDRTTGTMLAIIPVALMIAFYRAMQKQTADQLCGSPALLRYNKGVLLTSLGYLLGMAIAVYVWNNAPMSPGLAFGISLLPAIPTLAMIGVMGRYLTDESDEYLRYRAIMAALWGLGLVLTLGTFWGFLEMFEVVPHIWSWWVLPAWAIGMGLGYAVRSGKGS